MSTSLEFSPSHELYRVVEPLRQVVDMANSHGIETIVVGAVARDIAYFRWGCAPLRATADIDVAVAVPGWNAYEELRSRFPRDPRVPMHRLLVAGVPVDLVPFGGVEDANRMIAWPPAGTYVMSVFGFAEAQAAAVEVHLDTDLTVAVASAPGLAALKIVAWSDRSITKPRSDGVDFGHLLRDYGDSWNHDRIYGRDMAVLDAYDFDPTAAGAALLGRDVAALFTASDLPRLVAIVEPQLVEDSRMIRDMEGNSQLNRELLIAFHAGLVGLSGG